MEEITQEEFEQLKGSAEISSLEDPSGNKYYKEVI
tara:strand:+ start:232 stop:336 length:105 start_codon:yes stop_codon:yes gene_type:complete